MQNKDFDLEIEDILADNGKKKKKNSGDKGQRAERELCKKLSARFGKPFERSVGSGNRWSQVKGMTQAAKDVYLGDITPPEGFLWVLESKCGYEDKVDIHNIWLKGNKTLDGFVKQVSDDATRSGRKPILLYKRNLRPWLAFFRKADRPYLAGPTGVKPIEFRYSITYEDWMGVALETLLAMEDIKGYDNNDFWFK